MSHCRQLLMHSLFALMPFALASCSGGSPLIGKWSDGPNSSIEFVSGGTCLISPATAVGVSCTWEAASDGRVLMRESVMGSTFTFVGQLSGDELIFQTPDGKPMSPLHRVS